MNRTSTSTASMHRPAVGRMPWLGEQGWLERRFQTWLRRRLPPGREQILSHRSIFILPSRQGLGFGLLLLLMFIGGVNYEASLAYATVYLLLGLALLSILHTYRNLSGLRLSMLPAAPVYAGEQAAFPLLLACPEGRSHEALRLSFDGAPPVWSDLLENNEAQLTLYADAPRRGWLRPGRVRLESDFPFGLCRAWSLPDLDSACLVYPRPEPCDLPGLLGSEEEPVEGRQGASSEDFYGLRDYRPGDSPRRIAWKQLARGQGLFSKEFSGTGAAGEWLDWAAFPGLKPEARLSRLCWCALELERLQKPYGLRLPGLEIAPAQGAAHAQQVLQALALFQAGED